MRRLASLIAIFLFANLVHAQECQEYEDTCAARTQLNAMFQNLEKQRIPTGFLLDYAVNMIDVEDFDGVSLTNDNLADICDFEYLYRAIRSADVVSPKRLAGYGNVENTINADTTVISVPVLLYKYNYIVADALSSSKLSYSSSQGVCDVYLNGQWQDPYSQRDVFAFSPEINLITSYTVVYDFDSSLFFTNESVTSYSVNLDDGQGYRTLVPGNRITTSYSLDGSYTLTLQANLTDGRTLYAHSALKIQGEHTVAMSFPSFTPRVYPDTTITFTATSPNSNGIRPQATVSIKYMNGHSSLQTPVIFVEGFDPFPYCPYYKDSPVYYNKGYTNLDNLGDDGFMLTDYADVIYIDWFNCTESLSSNADLLCQIIQWVKTQTSTPAILIGSSMGGLISRIALSQMESNHQSHNIATFVSLDSPHLGANVPLGVTYLIRLLSTTWVNSTSLLHLLVRIFADNSSYNNLNLPLSPAVNQMLWYNVNDDLQFTRRPMGTMVAPEYGFPKGDSGIGMVNLAISDGGTNPVADTLLKAKAAISDSHIGYKIARNGKPSLYVDILHRNKYILDVVALPFKTNGGKVLSYNMEYYKRFLFFSEYLKTAPTRAIHAPNNYSSYYPLDASKGSSYSLDNLPINPFINRYTFGVGNYTIATELADSITFIPTVSSLCIGKGVREPIASEHQENFYTQTLEQLSRTPFHGIYVESSESKQHTYFNKDMWDWISAQSQIRGISGPDMATEGAQYTLANAPSGIMWSTSSSQTATIDTSGVLHLIKTNGSFRIIAEGYINIGNHNRPYHYEKPVFVGFPPCTLDSRERNGVQTVIAQLLNTSLEGIHYQWATKPQGRPTSSWIDSDSLEIVVDDDDLPGQVFFRMVYGDQYSQTYSIRLWQILIPAFNAPVLAQSNGSLLCLGKEGNESLDVKSGENSSPSCYITVEGHGMYFESPPYQDELFQRLLSFPDIVERIKTLRPWGTESMLLLPATIQIEGDESVYEHTITILAE